jgi:chemotaxis response regulator CheB
MGKRGLDMAKGGKRKLDTKADALQTSAEEATPSEAHGFRIVGIGASAGGLEALEQFFSNMPSDSGIAFVIVQRLDPTGHSSMPEILSRFTKMKIQVAADGLKVAKSELDVSQMDLFGETNERYSLPIISRPSPATAKAPYFSAVRRASVRRPARDRPGVLARRQFALAASNG